VNASAIAVTEAPRSEPNTALPPRGWLRAISCAETSQDAAFPAVETSTRRARSPLPATISRMNLSSSPLVSSVPTTSTVGRPELRAASMSRRGRAASSSLSTPVESARAPDSMRAIGTGCDHRVGGVGLEM